jgi:hypothetical protein
LLFLLQPVNNNDVTAIAALRKMLGIFILFNLIK